MPLELQFQSLAASFLYGLFLGFVYGFFNRLFFGVKWRWLRTILEIGLDTSLLAGYFFSIVRLNRGHFNQYMFLTLLVGVLIYLFVFSRGYLSELEGIMRFFRWLFSPIRFIFLKIRAILKKIRTVKRDGKKKKAKIKKKNKTLEY